MTPATTADESAAPAPAAEARRTLAVTAGAHALHDGYADLLYILLPLWQAEFGLGYGALAALRGLYMGSMALCQLPSGGLAGRLGGRAVLAWGTALAAFGLVVAGLSGGLFGLAAGLALSGAGSGTQHPIASAAVSRAYGRDARGPLGTYNFAGDVGKAVLPAAVGLLLVALSWRPALWIVAALGLGVAAAVALLMPLGAAAADQAKGARPGAARGGFSILLAIGMLDTGVRMGLLTFLPFLLIAKGAALPTVGLALALVFIGGAAGKLACGWLGARFGVLATVLVTEGATAAAILALLVLPLAPAMALLPVLGVALNGTSSVLYGTVPELAPAGLVERAFAVFYTGVIASGAVSPVLYGLLGDAAGVSWAVVATAAAALATLPLALLLAPRLADARGA